MAQARTSLSRITGVNITNQKNQLSSKTASQLQKSYNQPISPLNKEQQAIINPHLNGIMTNGPQDNTELQGGVTSPMTNKGISGYMKAKPEEIKT